MKRALSAIFNLLKYSPFENPGFVFECRKLGLQRKAGGKRETGTFYLKIIDN